MPVYEFVCTDCGERIQVRASIEEKEKGLEVKCEKCGSSKVARVFGFSVITSSKGSNAQSPPSGCCPGGGGVC